MKTIVIGGGATGLTVAFLLSRAGQSVEVYEAADRVGGLLNTFEVSPGARLEYFYHHFFTHDAEINWLFAQLGLEDSVRFRDSTMAIIRGGRCYPFNGVMDLLKFGGMSLSGRVKFGLTSALLAYRKNYCSREDKSALDWFYANAGRDATEAIWRPMLEVKFGEVADQIPLAWIAGRLRQRVLSRKKGAEKLGYLEGSLQKLTDALSDKLQTPGSSVHLSKSVKRFFRKPDRTWVVEFDDGSTATGDRVVFTIPSNILGKIWEPLSKEYSSRLRNIRYLGAVCTVLALKNQLSDYYWTNIADGQCDFGGVIEQTHLVPTAEYGDQHLVYLSKYALATDPIWKRNDQELVQRQVHQLESLYQRSLDGEINKTWVFRSMSAAPITDMGFRERIPSFQTPEEEVYAASMCHLYPEERSVNNSIRVAAELLRSMGEHAIADGVPRGVSTAGQVGHQRNEFAERQLIRPAA